MIVEGLSDILKQSANKVIDSISDMRNHNGTAVPRNIKRSGRLIANEGMALKFQSNGERLFACMICSNQ